jgi:hypothetical protein
VTALLVAPWSLSNGALIGLSFMKSTLFSQFNGASSTALDQRTGRA